jgi:hypothetical protein
MAYEFERVKKGDLIKSDLFNSIMDALESLDGRVEILEAMSDGDGKVVIVEPNPSQTFHIGGPLNIKGKNFGLPSQNIVTIQEKVIDTFKAGSNDALLIIETIPNVQNIPQEGKEVTLHLSNAIGNAETKFILAQPPLEKPTGTLKTGLSTTVPPTEPIEAGNNPVFTFTISAITTMDDMYIIQPKIDIGWKAELVNAQGAPISPPEVKIEKNPQPLVATLKDVKIKVSIPSTAPLNQIGKLSVTVTSKLNPELKSTSEETPLKVGGPAPVPDKIGITVSSVVTPGQRLGDDIIGLPTAAIGKLVTAKFTVTVPKNDMYKIANPTFSPNPGNIWTAEIVSTSNPVAMAAPEDKMTIKVKVPTLQQNPANTKMTLLVTSESDATIKGDREITLQVT